VSEACLLSNRTPLNMDATPQRWSRFDALDFVDTVYSLAEDGLIDGWTDGVSVYYYECLLVCCSGR